MTRQTIIIPCVCELARQPISSPLPPPTQYWLMLPVLSCVAYFIWRRNNMASLCLLLLAILSKRKEANGSKSAYRYSCDMSSSITSSYHFCARCGWLLLLLWGRWQLWRLMKHPIAVSTYTIQYSFVLFIYKYLLQGGRFLDGSEDYHKYSPDDSDTHLPYRKLRSEMKDYLPLSLSISIF